jgi:excisionase family DNA binding protein
MSEMLNDDVRMLRAALDDADETVHVSLSLPRASAEKVLALLDAERKSGAVVVPIKEAFTTTAASFLGVSRPTLMKMIAAGDIEHIMVGSHHRIPAEPLVAFERARRARRAKAAEALAEFSNEIGFVD